MSKPVGRNPIELDGIILRWSDELPDDKQALYDEKSGQILAVTYFGTRNPTIKATAITVSRMNYEAIHMSYLRAKARDQNHKFRLH